MLKKTIIGFMLALFAGPLAAHAEMPGQPCQKVQIGTTKMADDKQNIIACLETGEVPQPYQWKSMVAPKIPVCASNQLLMGDTSGKLKCMKMSCRVASSQAAASTFNFVSTATCNNDEFLLNGGGHTHPTTMGAGCPYHRIGYLHTSRPTQDMRGWNVDGFGILEWPSMAFTSVPGATPATTEACTIAYATCCSWVPVSN